MATFNYARSVATAARLLKKYGQAMTLTVVTAGPYDPATGENTQSSVDNAVVGVVFEIGIKRVGQSLQNGSLAEASDRQCLLTVEVVPNLLDKLVIGTRVFLIINIEELNPAGTVILYDLVLRSG